MTRHNFASLFALAKMFVGLGVLLCAAIEQSSGLMLAGVGNILLAPAWFWYLSQE
jgi:hypothetical protein